MYSESDYLKGELSRIRDKYDFSVIDKTKATLERYEAWSNKIMNVSSKSYTVFDSHYNCGLCRSTA